MIEILEIILIMCFIPIVISAGVMMGYIIRDIRNGKR